MEASSSSAVLYVLVGRPSCILADYVADAAAPSSVRSDARKVLDEMDHHSNTKVTYGSENVSYNVVVESSLVFLSVTHQDLSRPQAFAFLNVIQEEFYAQFGRLRNDQDYSPNAFNENFKPIMKRRTNAFNEASGCWKVERRSDRY